MAKKKSNQQRMEIKLAELPGEGQPQMVWPFVVTASGAGVALKGAELAAKGIERVIEATAPPLRFEIQDSWLEDEHEHRVKVHIRNTTKNGIYIESFDIKREYLGQEIDPNRTTQPTVRSDVKKIADDFTNRDGVTEDPLLVKANDVGTGLELSLPKVDHKKMKSERAVVTVNFANLGKEKSETIEFEFRLRWNRRK
jgi:hypothetical protein